MLGGRWSGKRWRGGGGGGGGGGRCMVMSEVTGNLILTFCLKFWQYPPSMTDLP